MLSRGLVASFRLLGKLKPRVVVGFGGYPTFPPLIAAWLTGTPRIVHEQNAVMGRANRALASRATAIATGYPNIFTNRPELAAKATHTGNPVRGAVRAAASTAYEAPEGTSTVRLLVFGGSQGARIMSEIVPGAIELCAQAMRSRFRVVQQCREDDVTEVKAVYARLGLAAEVATFFKDLPLKMAESQLVIARSGASTVAELAAIGRPAILVPLPHALDNDQLANAMALASAGGAMLMRQDEFTSTRLAEELTHLLTDPDTLSGMASAAKRTGNADATERLADLVLRVARVGQMGQNPTA
jgi:UDP-N-acetylglucosamine--N-acetylmuramyl-(pentapeptide) pyrophosphoryl-undecaprenol N-acetylglucosamine transferase